MEHGELTVEAEQDESYFDDQTKWRWIWRGGGSTQAHLIPEHKAARANPYTLCGRRLRKPRMAWSGVCRACIFESLDLKAWSEPFPDAIKK